MTDIDSIPSDIEAGTIGYWKYRSRQWQKRCDRSEREKSEIIGELNEVRAQLRDFERRTGRTASVAPIREETRARREAMAAVRSGDVYSGLSAAPRGL
ncbi:hypothetical protein [Demequina sp. SO4-18]|uniref:hypothetical protein n=1 Tax=Demequina sp. SO4-18 TaxID=3401026 RepID=UPI003B5A1681